MSVRHRTRSEREQLELFRALPGDLAPRDAQDLMAYPFFSLAKTHRTTPIDYRMNDIAIRVEAVPEHGMATIWDADVLIWAATQIVQARVAGLRTSRLMAATPYEILTFIGRGTSARDYHRLKAAFDRWLYRLVRKHAGKQRAGWRFDFRHLYLKSASLSPFKRFAFELHDIARRQPLPGYRLGVDRASGGRELLAFVSDTSLSTRACGQALEALVPSGTAGHVPSGTAPSCYQEPEAALSPSTSNASEPPNLDSNEESNSSVVGGAVDRGKPGREER